MTQRLSSRPAELSLAVWLAPFAAGRRVLWIGDAASGGADLLAAQAESMRVLDTSGRGRRRRGGAVRASTFRPGPIDLPPGTFEIAIVPEVAVLDDLSVRLRELAGAVGDDGVVVAGTAADDECYDALRSALGDACGVVRVVGQASFLGVAIADLAADMAAEVVVDGTLAPASGIDRVYALGAMELPVLDPYLVVQLPSEPSTAAMTTAVELEVPREEKDRETAVLREALVGRSREADALREALQRAEGRLEQLQGRLVSTESELAEMRASVREREASEHSEDSEELATLEERLRDRGQRVRALESELARRALLVRDLTEELREHQLGRRGGGARWLEAEAARTEAELATDELRMALVARDEELAAARRQEADLRGQALDLRARIEELAGLREVAVGRARSLEAEVAERVVAQQALEAKVHELDEQIGLVEAKARGAATEGRPPHGASTDEVDARVAALEESERRLSARVGELSGQLVAAKDLVEQLEAERDRSRAETLRLAAQLSAFETRVEGLRRGYEHRIAMLGAEVVEIPGHAAATDEVTGRALSRLREELSGVRGERDGLRLRLLHCEAALASASARRPLSSDAPRDADLVERLREEVSSLHAQSRALELRSVDLTEAKERAEERVADVRQKLASRDALLSRLQMDLAAEEQTAKLLDEKVARARAEVTRLREAVVDASSAVDAKERAEKRLAEATELLKDAERRAAEGDVAREKLERLEAEAAETHSRTQGELVTLRERAERAEVASEELRAEHERVRDEEARALQTARADLEIARAEVVAQEARAREARAREVAEAVAETERTLRARLGVRDDTLEEMRVGLTDLRRLLDGWRVEEGAARRRAAITEVGLEAPEGEDARVVRMERELDDKDTLLRSLTAELEERDALLRTLERRLEERDPDEEGDDVRRELLELQERIARLHDELSQEREARGAAEDRVEALRRRPEADEEMVRLERALREREVVLREAESRARDVESLRGVFVQAREGLESLLAAATDRGDPRTAERISELLGVLGRFS